MKNTSVYKKTNSHGDLWFLKCFQTRSLSIVIRFVLNLQLQNSYVQSTVVLMDDTDFLELF